MNERIRELAHEAKLGSAEFDNGITYYVATQETFAKFTNLIIKESIKVMMENDYHGEWLGEKLKEHFGVEE